MTTKTAKRAATTTTRTTEEPTMTTTTRTAGSIETISTLKGDTLIEVYRLTFGEAPKPKTPTPVLRRRIIEELERRAGMPAPETVNQPDPDAEIEAAHDEAMTAARDAVSAGADPTVCSNLVARYHDGEIDRDAFLGEMDAAVTSANAAVAPVATEVTRDAMADGAATTAAPAADDANVGETGATDEVAASAPTIEAPKARRGRKPASATVVATTAPTTDLAPSAKPEVDRALPPVGTKLQKLDRHGRVRCEAEIVEGGVLFAGTVYKSLSASAIAASQSLGNQTKQTSGPKFWGLVESAPRTHAAKAIDLDAIERVWSKYRERADAAVAGASEGDKAQLRDLLLRHSVAIFDLATVEAATTEVA